MLSFECRNCGERHEGMPAFGWDYPVPYLAVPEPERDARCRLTSDTCVIDDGEFFVRGCIELPVRGEDDVFSWGVWASLSAINFRTFQRLYDAAERSNHGPFFGWLSTHIWIYPETLLLKTMVHLRDNGARPYIELEPTDHPLAIEQRQGITLPRVLEIFEAMTHPSQPEESGTS